MIKDTQVFQAPTLEEALTLYDRALKERGYNPDTETFDHEATDTEKEIVSEFENAYEAHFLNYQEDMETIQKEIAGMTPEEIIRNFHITPRTPTDKEMTAKIFE